MRASSSLSAERACCRCVRGSGAQRAAAARGAHHVDARSTGNSCASAWMSRGSTSAASTAAAREVAAERVDHAVERLERHRLALVAAAREHDRAALRSSAVEEALDQRGLAHAGRAVHERQHRRARRRWRRARARARRSSCVAADERRAALCGARPRRARGTTSRRCRARAASRAPSAAAAGSRASSRMHSASSSSGTPETSCDGARRIELLLLRAAPRCTCRRTAPARSAPRTASRRARTSRWPR